MVFASFYIMFELVTSDTFSDMLVENEIQLQFKHDCNSRYGVGNWSEYNITNRVDFMNYSISPVHFNETGIFACFKTGKFP